MKAAGKELGQAFFLNEQRRPLHRSTDNLMLQKYQEKSRLPWRSIPKCPRRSGRRHPVDPGLSRELHHSAHRH